MRILIFIVIFQGVSICSAQWTSFYVGQNETFRSIDFINKDTGFVGGLNLYKTADGGANWSAIMLNTPYGKNDLHFFDSDNGFVLEGKYNIYRTYNGGISWQQFIVDSSPQFSFSKCWFVDSQNGNVVGENASIFNTNDGGVTWSLLPSIPLFGFTNYPLNCLFFCSDSIGYSGGGIPGSSARSILLKTIDGGNSWFKVFESTPFYSFKSLYFLNETIGWAIGDCFVNNPSCVGTRIMFTTDGGSSWGTVDTIDGVYANYPTNLVDLCFMNADTGFAIGNNSQILATFDGGLTWTYNAQPLAFGFSGFLDCPDNLNCFASIDSGVVYKYSAFTGFNEFDSLADNIVVYPNPIKSYFNIKCNRKDAEMIINIIDMFGRIIICESHDSNSFGNVTLMAAFPAGLYLLNVKFIDDPNPLVMKILKINEN